MIRQRDNREVGSIASLLGGGLSNPSSKEMERLQTMLTNSLETGQALLFTDQDGQLWEIMPREDLNIEELPIENDDELMQIQNDDEIENPNH